MQHNVELQPYNSFRTKGCAKLLATPTTEEEIQQLISSYPTEKKLVLGNGCNLFFTGNFDGLVIKPEMRGIEVIDETDSDIDLKVGAGEEWDNFVAYCVEHGYAGVENLSLIPSSVGAAPFQNIGAYGAEVKDTIIGVHAIGLSNGQSHLFTADECLFDYRNSMFKQTRAYVITYVVFRLNKSYVYHPRYADLNHELADNPSPTLHDVREAIITIRQRKLPDHKVLPNAGSFFKNPILTPPQQEALLNLLPEAPLYPTPYPYDKKTSAAYLIEQAGWKGKRLGNVGVSSNHALILINYGASDGNEIIGLMHAIQADVNRLYGIQLEPEVQMV